MWACVLGRGEGWKGERREGGGRRDQGDGVGGGGVLLFLLFLTTAAVDGIYRQSVDRSKHFKFIHSGQALFID